MKLKKNNYIKINISEYYKIKGVQIMRNIHIMIKLLSEFYIFMLLNLVGK